MSERTWYRLGAASGLLFVVLQFAGFGIGGAARGFERITLTSSDAALAEAIREPVPSAVWVGGYVEVLAYLVFVVFAAWVAAALRASGRAPDWAPLTILAAGLLVVATSFIGYATEAAAYYRADREAEPAVARALLDTGSFAYALAWGGLALFVAASAGAGLRTRAFPRWLSLPSLLLAAAFLVSLALPTSAVGEVADLLLWIWIVAASVVLYRRGPLPIEAAHSTRFE